MTGTTIFRQNLAALLADKFTLLRRRNQLPAPEAFRNVLLAANRVLLNEDEAIRPPDLSGVPGGLIRLDPDIPVLVLPDLHSRVDFLLNVLTAHRPMGGTATVLERLELGTLQLLCIGDAIHSEGHALKRWRRAMEEFQDGFTVHAAMDEEMLESLILMEMLLLLKISFPARFHFLKGNHENITNEEGEGNHPFAKFALEGPMVYLYMKKFYSEKVLFPWYLFEKRLPLLAAGGTFLASHAEPARFYDACSVTNYRSRPDVTEGLTWTDNGEAEPGSVRMMLDHYLGPEFTPVGRYLTGHRAVGDRYNLRAEGLLIQFHNPAQYPIALVEPDRGFDPARDIRFLNRRTPLFGRTA